MRTLKLRLESSLTAQAMLLLPLGVGVAALLRRDEHPGWWVLHGVLYTSIAIGIQAVQRRRAGRAAGTDPRGVVALNRRIRQREMPEDPEEQVAMGRLVATQLEQTERAGRWLPYWLGLMGLVAVGVLVLGIATGSLALPLLFVVGVIGFCCWVLWMRRRTLDRYRHMRSALREQGERVP